MSAPDAEISTLRAAAPGSLKGVALGVAYDGTAFHGFAPQREVRTVYGALLECVQSLSPDVSKLHGLSRTDTGVHARAQIVAFDSPRDIPLRGWVLGLNRRAPADLSVRWARAVPTGFVPRFFARNKRYVYTLSLDPLRDPLRARYSWQVPHPFDRELARRELESALGRHDFAAFRKQSDPREDTLREITRAELIESPSLQPLPEVALVFEGAAFMHNMVRILVGTVVDVATGKKPAGSLRRALDSRRREDAGRTAPPQGLSLERSEVAWPQEDETWPTSV